MSRGHGVHRRDGSVRVGEGLAARGEGRGFASRDPVRSAVAVGGARARTRTAVRSGSVTTAAAAVISVVVSIVVISTAIVSVAPVVSVVRHGEKLGLAWGWRWEVGLTAGCGGEKKKWREEDDDDGEIIGNR